VHDAAYGGYSLWKMADTHRDDAGLVCKNDRVPIWKQCNLELVEEKKLRNHVVRCDNDAAIKAALNSVPTRKASPPSPPRRWQFPSGVGSR
jgi:hypothetical protein